MSQKLAVCIGINDYPGTGSDLYGCVNDANDWANMLELRGFLCRRILNAEATRNRICDELVRLAEKAGNGTLSSYFSRATGRSSPIWTAMRPMGTTNAGAHMM